MTTLRRTETEAVRREQILAAARKVFREKGYANATISDIVKEAGVAQGTFYLYFSSKLDAVGALADSLLAQTAPRLLSLSTSTTSFEEMLRGFVHVMFQVGRENPDLCRLLHAGPEVTREDFREMKEAKAQSLLANMGQMLQGAIDAGEMAPMNTEIAVRLLQQILITAIHDAFIDGEDADLLEEATAQILVNGLKTRP